MDVCLGDKHLMNPLRNVVSSASTIEILNHGATMTLRNTVYLPVITVTVVQIYYRVNII